MINLLWILLGYGYLMDISWQEIKSKLVPQMIVMTIILWELLSKSLFKPNDEKGLNFFWVFNITKY